MDLDPDARLHISVGIDLLIRKSRSNLNGASVHRAAANRIWCALHAFADLIPAHLHEAYGKTMQRTYPQPSKKERAVIRSMGSFAVKETVQAPVRTAPGYHDARRAIRCSLKQISSV